MSERRDMPQNNSFAIMQGGAGTTRRINAVVLKPSPARPSGVTREAIFIGKKT